jgi:streptomycin 3"-adenylyltransferase
MEMPDDVTAQADAATGVIRDVIGPYLLSVYLYGSAVAGGLRPESDLDLFVLAGRRLTPEQKRQLVEGLTPISWRRLRAPAWRPLEVTVVVQSEVRPWRYPPRMDFQFGEWLRADFDRGAYEPGMANPDVAVLVSMVRLTGVPLLGPSPDQVLDPVPRADLIRAMTAGLDALLGDLESDTRNVLLTLARVWSTIATGEFHSKDVAAAWALKQMGPDHRPVLELARAAYLGRAEDDWRDLRPAAKALAAYLTHRIRLAGAR